MFRKPSLHYQIALIATVTSVAVLQVVAGCTSGSSGAGSSTGASVSGTLTQATVAELGNPVSQFEAASATTGTKVSLDCGAKGTFTADVNATTGAFSVAGVPTGVPCSFNFVGTNGAVKCQVQFQDTSSYDLNHNAMSTNTATPSGSVAMGAITCDSAGAITVPASSIAGVSAGTTVALGTAFDFTGVWTVAAFDGTLPSGYTTPVNCTNNCNGPALGQNITLIRFHGTKFTPNSGQCTPAINVTCPLTSGTEDRTVDGYAMSIWGGNYATGVGACGGKTGFTTDEARAYAGLNLDTQAPTVSGGPQLSYGHYAWSAAPTGFATDAGWTQPWMWGGATSTYAVQDCQPVSVPSTSGSTAKAGFACFAPTVTNGTPTSTYVWNVSLQNAGGCVDSSGNPLMVNNWQNITFGTCTNTASAFNSNMSTSSCTYTGAPNLGGTSTTFTCSYTGGNFTDLAGTTTSGSNNGPNFSAPYAMPANTWAGQPGSIINAGGTCAGSTEAILKTAVAGGGNAGQKAAKELLARYQCYANAYWQHTSNGGGSTSCNRNYNFDWSATNYLNFLIGDDRSAKPQNAFITDRVFYSPDGQWAFLKNSDLRFQSIPTASGSTLCPMNQIVELKFNRVTDGKLLVNFTQKTVMADRSTTCQAAVAAALAGGGTLSPDPTGLNNLYRDLQTTRMIWYMTK